jgi:drug/metabolite transporter (DMT)-like permease
MMILVLCILANVALVVCFKLYPRFGVDTFSAIVINYWVSMTLGCIMLGYIPLTTHPLMDLTWTGFAAALGIVFTMGFYVIGRSVKYVGMTITAAMQKMSLLIPTAYALIVYDEPWTVIKLTGIALSIVAIVLVTRKADIRIYDLRKLLPYFILPLGALLFSGVIETVLYYVDIEELALHGDIAFTTYAFSVAAVLGSFVLIYRAVRGLHRFTWKDVFGGVVLGMPNFFSIYLILVLLSHGYGGSTLYPILNILILSASALTGMLLFRERLSAINVVGLVVALCAILLVSLG